MHHSKRMYYEAPEMRDLKDRKRNKLYKRQRPIVPALIMLSALVAIYSCRIMWGGK